MNQTCPICRGTGAWTDYVRQQTILCPLCSPLSPVEPRKDLPGWVTSRWPKLEAKYYGAVFPIDPWLLVIHSGATAPGVAEFFHKTGRVKNRRTGKWVYVSAHLSWSDEVDDLVQCVPFTHVGFHVGGSRLRWNDRLHTHLNFCSYGIELPGPNRPKWPTRILDRLRAGVVHLQEELPKDRQLQVVVRHQDIDEGKRDPGNDPAIFECLYDLDLAMPFHKVA